jgi:hypothetical protein
MIRQHFVGPPWLAIRGIGMVFVGSFNGRVLWQVFGAETRKQGEVDSAITADCAHSLGVVVVVTGRGRRCCLQMTCL